MAVGKRFRTVAVVNIHLEPAHVESVKKAVDEATKAGANVCFTDVTKKRWAERLGPAFLAGDHAGAFETSLVMAAAPDKVREKTRISLPPMDGLMPALKKGAKTFMEAGGEDAYFGDPTAATVEEGEALFVALADILALSIMEHLGSKACSVFQTSILVRFGDLDGAGIAYYPNLVNFLHEAFEDFFVGHVGRPYPEVHKSGLSFPSVKVEMEFFSPVHYGDHVDVGVIVERVGRSSVQIRYEGSVGGKPVFRGAQRRGHGGREDLQAHPGPGLAARALPFRDGVTQAGGRRGPTWPAPRRWRRAALWTPGSPCSGRKPRPCRPSR